MRFSIFACAVLASVIEGCSVNYTDIVGDDACPPGRYVRRSSANTWECVQLTEADIQAALGEVLSRLEALEIVRQRRACRLSLNNAQVIPNQQPTTILFQESSFDTGSFFDRSMPERSVVIPPDGGGRYLVMASAQFERDPAGDRVLELLVDGNGVAEVNQPNTPSGETILQVSALLELNRGQTVGVLVNHNAGRALAVHASDNTRFEMVNID